MKQISEESSGSEYDINVAIISSEDCSSSSVALSDVVQVEREPMKARDYGKFLKETFPTVIPFSHRKRVIKKSESVPVLKKLPVL